jgi:cytochrome c oxidase subunit 2
MKFKLTMALTMTAILTVLIFAALSGHAQAPKKSIAVTASRFKYEPSEITLKKGEPVVLVFTTADVQHGISFKDLQLQVKVGKGGPTAITFTPTRTGEFVGTCSVFCGSGHGSMTLTLHVVE